MPDRWVIRIKRNVVVTAVSAAIAAGTGGVLVGTGWLSHDTQPPRVFIKSPTATSADLEDVAEISVICGDKNGCAGVQLKVDGANVGAEDTVEPFTISWDTSTVADDDYELTVVARDPAGNTTPPTSAVTVSVVNAVLGNLWVGAAGSCTRSGTRVAYNAGTSCGTSDAARDLAVTGDQVGINSQSFAVAHAITNAGGATFTSPGVTFKCEGTPLENPCTFQSGFHIQCDWCIVDGISAYTELHQSAASMTITSPYTVTEGPQLQNVTVKNSHLWGLSSGDKDLANIPTVVTGATLYMAGLNNVTIGPNNIIGPTCCSADALNLYHNGYVGNDNVVFTRNKILGSFGGCPQIPAGDIPAGAPACDGFGPEPDGLAESFVGDPDDLVHPFDNCLDYGNVCEHVDGIHAGDCNGCVFEYNEWRNAGAMAWFMSGFGPGPYPNMCNITLKGNDFRGNGNPGGGGVPANTGSAGQYCGEMKILYNTFSDGFYFRYYLCNDCVTPVQSHVLGTTAKIVGNLFLGGFRFTSNGGFSPDNCSQDGLNNLTTTYTHNINADGDCSALDASNRTLAASVVDLVNQASYPWNLHLDVAGTPGQTPVDNGESFYCGPGKDVEFDIDGDARPASGCDLGSDEGG